MTKGLKALAAGLVLAMAGTVLAGHGALAAPVVFDFAALVDGPSPPGPGEGPFVAPFNPWTIGGITLTASASRSDKGSAVPYLDEFWAGHGPAGLGVCSIAGGACQGTNDDNTNFGDGDPNVWTETLILSFSDASGPIVVTLDPIVFRDSDHHLAITSVGIDDGGGAVAYSLVGSTLSAPANPVRGTTFLFTPTRGNDFYIATVTATRYVPEPGTLTLFGFALAGLGWVRRRAGT